MRDLLLFQFLFQSEEGAKSQLSIPRAWNKNHSKRNGSLPCFKSNLFGKLTANCSLWTAETNTDSDTAAWALSGCFWPSGTRLLVYFVGHGPGLRVGVMTTQHSARVVHSECRRSAGIFWKLTVGAHEDSSTADSAPQLTMHGSSILNLVTATWFINKRCQEPGWWSAGWQEWSIILVKHIYRMLKSF